MIYDIANICSVISLRRVGENLLFGIIVNVENVDRGLCSLAHIVTHGVPHRFAFAELLRKGDALDVHKRKKRVLERGH